MVTRILIVAGVLMLFAGVIIWGVSINQSIGGTEMSFHGWTALIAGSVLSCLVGAVLMALIFRSNRSGHDAEVYDFSEDDPDGH